MRASNARKSIQPFGQPGATPEQRRTERVVLSCNALIRLDETLTFRARLTNISVSGVQVSCDPRYALMIHPSGDASQLDGGRLLDIAIALPDGAEEEDFKVRCRVKYCVEHGGIAAPAMSAGSLMLLGLQFARMDFATIQRLDGFIESHLLLS